MSFRRPSLLTDIATLRSLSSGSGVSSMTAPKPEDDDNEFLDLDEITLPSYRPLSNEELTLLRDLLRGTLTLHNCSCALQAQEDAVDLINYACELLTGNEEDNATKMTVRAVLEELELMELEICGHDSLEQMRMGLVKFISTLYDRDRKAGLTIGMNSMNSHKKKVAARSQSMPDGDMPSLDEFNTHTKATRRSSLQSQMRESENHVSGFDLSAKTAAMKKREELRRISSRTKSIKERMAMYNSDGGLRNFNWFVEKSELDDDDLDDFESLDNFKDQASIDVARQNELEDITNDTSLTEKERSERLEGCRAKYGLAEMKLKIARVSFHKGSSSFHKPPGKSKSFHKESSFHEPAERSVSFHKGSSFHEPVERSSSVSFYEPPEKSKSFHVPMPSKKDIVPRAERELKANKGRRSSIDLSAKSAVVKQAQELAVLKSGASSSMSIKERMEMYKKSTSFHDKQDDGERKFLEDKGEKTIDDLRREELLQVMKDRSLSREEKSKKMEEVKQRYASMAGGSEPEQEVKPTTTTKEVDDSEKQRRSELQSIMRDKSLSREERKQKMEVVRRKYSNNKKDGNETSSTESMDSSKVMVDLSAKSYAERRRASLESLEQSISFYSHGEGGENDGEQHHVMSIRERLFVYRNNDEIVNEEEVVGC